MTSKWTPLDPVPGFPAGTSADVSSQRRPTPPVAPGAVVDGKYRIDHVIGFGGMGIVCGATHLELGTPIAIKFVRPERASDERAVARFLTEARATAQLKSQFSCRVLDCGRLPTGTPYIVMEHLTGADLRTMLSTRGPLPVEEVVSFALQACEALAEAHAKHIVHRDVKPENLFVTEGPDGTPVVKVLDFGISKQVGSLAASRNLTEPTESVGSPFHMSPEQMIDPASVDSRTDIWSLGVVLYELLTGRLPFTGESTPQVCASVMTTQPSSPLTHRPDLPEGLAEVVLRCLEKDRERRFRDVAELGLALKEFGGSASSLAAARLERILGKTPGKSIPVTPPTPTPAPISPAPVDPVALGPAPSPGSSTGSHATASDLEELPERPAGVPRRGFGLRLLVATVFAAASGVTLYAVLRPPPSSDVLEPLPSPAAPTEIGSVSAALPSSSAPAPSATVSSSARPRVQAPIVRRPAQPAPDPAPRPSKPELPEPEPELPAEPVMRTPDPSIYPETKPLPDLPPPE